MTPYPLAWPEMMPRCKVREGAALPAPGKRSWRAVLGIVDGVPVNKALVESFYRDAARRAHPDTGGSNAAMAEVNDARTAALREIG